MKFWVRYITAIALIVLAFAAFAEAGTMRSFPTYCLAALLTYLAAITLPDA